MKTETLSFIDSHINSIKQKHIKLKIYKLIKNVGLSSVPKFSSHIKYIYIQAENAAHIKILKKKIT